MRSVADFIGLLVWDDLYLLRLRPGVFSCARNPEPGIAGDLSVFRGLRADAYDQRAGLFRREWQRTVAVCAGLSIGLVEHRGLALGIKLFLDQFGMKRRLDRFAIIIKRLRGKVDLLARLIEIFLGSCANLEAAVGRDYAIEARDLTPRLIGNARLDAVMKIVFVGAGAGWDGDSQLSIGIELAGLLRLLLATIVAAFISFTLAAFATTSAGFEVILISTLQLVIERRPIRGFMDHVLDLSAHHRLPKEIFCGDGCGDRLSLQNAWLVRRDPHIVLRFLVLLDVEAR